MSRDPEPTAPDPDAGQPPGPEAGSPPGPEAGQEAGQRPGPEAGPPMGQNADESERVGLCTRCVHAREITSGRGSTFWRCARADIEPGFARYPRLPVATCRGYEAGRG